MEENMIPTPSRRSARRALLLLPVVALALGGCAVGFSPDGPPAVDAGAPSTPIEAPETETPEVDGPDDSGLPTRAEIEAEVTKEVTCGGGELEVSDIGAVVEVIDDCARLTVSGDASVVLAAGVETLDISAAGAVVLVGSVESVALTGDATTVLWESGSPRVDDASFGSVLRSVGTR